MMRFSSRVLQVATPPAVLDLKKYNALRIIPTNDDEDQLRIPLDVLVRFTAYAAFLAILLMIMALIVKLLVSLMDGDGSSAEEASETNSLLPKEEVSFSYGTCDQEDIECGESNCSSSSEDLYDGKICVICFDNQRSCFFIPCGHCVTCHSCANRITDGESKTCPICRRLIQKVNKLFVS